MSKIYKVGRIYCLRSNNTEDIYIGSTFNPLYKRLGQHKTDYKNNLNITSKNLMKFDDVYIELIEQYENITKEELNKYEGEHIRKNEKCVNKFIAGRTQKQYRDEHKEKMKTYNEIYQKENKKKLSEQKKEYNLKNKDIINKKRSEIIICFCGTSYTKRHKARHEKSLKHKNCIKN